MYDKQYALLPGLLVFLLFPDRCYPLWTRARECEYGCKSTLECIGCAARIM